MDAYEKKCMETIWYWFKLRHNKNKTGRNWARLIIKDHGDHIRRHRKYLSEISTYGD